MKADTITIRGANQHNLQGLDIDLPKNSLIVFTGVSGSGKSSLAFDTIFVEGQRRYVESLSTYARQFLAKMGRPDVDHIEGLGPAIAIDQGTRSNNPRSTVATLTEISDFLRVLYAAIGEPHCPECGEPIGSQTRDSIIGRIMGLPAGSRVMIMAPVVRSRKGEFQDLLEDMSRRGYVRARVNGELLRINEVDDLDRYRRHDIDIVVDRVKIKDGVKSRVGEAVEDALDLAEGSVVVSSEGGEEFLLSSSFACDNCGRSIQEPTHATFSFNSPRGMCQTCNGLGEERRLVPELLVSDMSKSLEDGAIPLLRTLNNTRRRHWFQGVAHHYGFSLDTPLEELDEEQWNGLFYGSNGEDIEYYFKHPRRGWEWRHADPWEGAIEWLMRRYRDLKSGHARKRFEDAMRVGVCPDCGGARLNEEALAFTIGGKNIAEITEMTVAEAHDFFQDLTLSETDRIIAEDAVAEIRERLGFLMKVGLHYLALNRTAPTLSGGEAQRVRLATQVGSGLVDCIYILDEPSIGLHHRDQGRLLETLKELRDLDNTIIVVEHDEQTMRAADHIVDFGPGAGREGGKIVAQGTPKQVARTKSSLTAQYLTGDRTIENRGDRRREANGEKLIIRGARHNNLKNINVTFPLGQFICITGVSGSGKSSLVTDTLHPALANELQGAQQVPGQYETIEGADQLDKVVVIDQDPIGRTPRSTPATYTKVLDHIRRLYAQLPESRKRGYEPGRFSFNVKEGRCENCGGYGAIKLESDFLADVWVECEECQGRRFDRETLDVRYKGKSIADVFEMSVEEALEHFENQPKIRRILQTLHDVGLGYIQLGQPATTLSGGEAQRIKLARELARPRSGGTLYILDEPTTGLHFEDVSHLLDVLHRFVDEGNTVIIVEHHPDVIKTADHVIDLGPEGGAEGGRIVASGTPEEVAGVEDSPTGQMLQEVLFSDEVAALPSRYRKPHFETDYVEVTGARQHNLKNISARIPRRQMTAFSGVSGSGKTSLAIDTIYAEGQRRYVESLSPYARQFISQMEKPKVDAVRGLSPAVVIDNTNRGSTPRSTVGTVTEIYDYLRVLMARLGEPHCPACGAKVGAQSVDQIVDRILTTFGGEHLLICAPLHPDSSDDYATLLERAERDGWRRMRLDGEVHRLPYEEGIDRRRHHEVEIVVDRLRITSDSRSRLAEAVESAFGISGEDVIAVPEEGEQMMFSRLFACHECGESYEQITPRSFSFNHAEGWCPRCEGLGTERGVDPAILMPDETKTIRNGGVRPWGEIAEGSLLEKLARAVANHAGFSLDDRIGDLTDEQRHMILSGTDEPVEVGDGLSVRYPGIVPTIDDAGSLSREFRKDSAQLIRDRPCSACGGDRVRPEAAAVRFRGHTIGEICDWPLSDAEEFFNKVTLSDVERPRAEELLAEIRKRLSFLNRVGLDYLNLNRSAPTLSGGESQRVRLASQLGADLTGVLYVLDEPTVGIHPRDNARMLSALKSLRDEGNTVIVVEHDPQTLEHADHLMDFGPRAGRHGGEIIATGTEKGLMHRTASVTGKVLSGELQIRVPEPRRPLPDDEGWLEILGARHHNLQNIDVQIPLERLTVVTGPSGSGKSSLIGEILYPEMMMRLQPGAESADPGLHRDITGADELDRIVNVDQSPIGQTPRSNPATYVGAFDEIRKLYAQLPLARMRGYAPGRFSFNKSGGRCEACEGMGSVQVEMHFLPDVWVHCEECGGKRFNEETLEVEYRGHNIGDVLDMTVEEALEVFSSFPKIARKLKVLDDVGLGYLPLGQPAPSLSGGEAQRVKLASELGTRSRGHTLYLLDEPTTGLHTADINRLLRVINSLVDRGNTVVIIEHNLDVIKTADYIVDLGPGGGIHGGGLVVSGRPEDVADCDESETAPYLAEVLEKSDHASRAELYELEELEIEDDGEAERITQQAAPWEEDGRKWHFEMLTTPEGERPDWPQETLEGLIEAIEELPEGVNIDWAHRDHLQIRADGESREWIQVKTEHEFALELVMFTPKGLFDEGDLSEALSLPVWNDISDLPYYGKTSRVRVYTSPRNYDRVRILLHYPDEVNAGAFRQMLETGWQAHRERVESE